MCNLVINIRFYDIHFQLEKGKWLPRFTLNKYHSSSNWPDGKFRIYKFFGLE